MEESYLKEISNTILSQLNIRRTEMWAWGAKNYYYLERSIEDDKYPAFQFSIKTPKIRRGGRVIISLDEGTDTYIVEAVRIFKGEEKIIGKKVGVFCDQLHDIINSLIEDEETYTNIFV